MAADALDITIDGDEGVGARTKDPDLAALIAKALEPVKAELTRATQLADERAEQVRVAQRLADERAEAATRALADVDRMARYTSETERTAIHNAILATETEAATVQSELAAAIDIADGKRAAELQRRMSALEARKQSLEIGKSKIEDEIRVAAARAQDPPAQPQVKAAPVADTYEALIANLPAKQKEWLRAHKDKNYVRVGEGPSPKLLKAFYDAKDQGLDETSDAFLAHMDRVLGHVKSGGDAGGDASSRFEKTDADEADPGERFFIDGVPASEAKPKAPAPQKKAIPSAPVSRNGGMNTGGVKVDNKSYRLSAEQLQTASRLGMTPDEYVKGALQGMQRGKIPASFFS